MFPEKFLNQNKKLIITVSILATFYILPIILANEPFNDDLWRSIFGTRWNMDGRPFASFLFEILNFSARLVNSAPLPILIFTAIYVLCMVKFCSEFIRIKSWNNTKKSLICLLPLLNPFLLENLSFQYDAFQISVLGGCIALFVIKPNYQIKSYLISILFLVLLLSTYQVALSIYLAMICFEIFNSILAKKFTKEIFHIFLNRTLVLLSGCLIYFFIIPQIFTLSDYALARSHFLAFDKDLLQNIFHNISLFLYAYYDLIKSFKIEYAIIIVLFINACFIILKNHLNNKSVNNRIINIAWIFTTLLAPFITAIIAILPFCIFKNQIAQPRTMMAFSIVLIVLFIPIFQIINKKFCILVCLIILSSYNCSYAYGQTLKHEFEHQRYIASVLSLDLSNKTSNAKYLHFINKASISRWYKLTSTKYPFFKRIIPVYLNQDYPLGYAFLLNNFDLALKDNNFKISSNYKNYKVSDSKFYSLYFVDDTAIVEFKN